MVLIQLLLPTVVVTAEGRRSTVAAIAETRHELERRFDGLTAYTRSIAQGVWTSPDGGTATDDVLLVEVVTDRFDRSWWKDYAAQLAGRFHQRVMHIRAWDVEMPDHAAS